jgi:hypothetical protein
MGDNINIKQIFINSLWKLVDDKTGLRSCWHYRCWNIFRVCCQGLSCGWRNASKQHHFQCDVGLFTYAIHEERREIEKNECGKGAYVYSEVV